MGVGVASEGARSDAVATTAAYVGNRIMKVEILLLGLVGYVISKTFSLVDVDNAARTILVRKLKGTGAGTGWKCSCE